MRLCIISFTENGKRLSESIKEKIDEIEIELFTKYKAGESGKHVRGQTALFVEETVGEWAGKQMREKNAMLFIGACGIAVRAVAPHLTDKLHDSPVLVMDEGGRYAIPILSGHLGGANELAARLAKRIGAEPVITTATDINGKFAVDLFAKRNGLFIVNKDGIAKVSSKALEGGRITLSIETGHRAEEAGTWEKGNLPLESSLPEKRDLPRKAGLAVPLPQEVRIVPYPPDGPVDVLVTSREGEADASLLLRPREYVIGMGCRRGKGAEEMEDFIGRKIKELGISITQIFALASISQKREEQGITAWCRKEGIPFLTYTPEELKAVEGDFRKSSFVMDTVGVDNVCERAAIKACGPGGRLISEKYAEAGMTIAVAKRVWRVGFYGE